MFDINKEYNLLIVEQNDQTIDEFCQLFKETGYQLFTASNINQSIEIVKKEPIDLALIDLGVVQKSPAEPLQNISNIRPGLLSILLTSEDDMPIAIDAINSGLAFSYIVKPWHDKDIILQIKQALHAKGLQETQKALEATNYNLKMDFSSVIYVFLNLLSYKNSTKPYENYKISDYVRVLAFSLKCSEAEVQDTYYAGLLHNIGEIYLPSELIAKPYYELSEEELRLYQKVPLISEFCVLTLETLHGAAKIIHGHRELIDGSGFPGGLKGEDIPLGAQILCVVVDYHKLMNGTLYSEEFSAKQARAFLKNAVGTRYKKEIVESFIDILECEDTLNKQVHDTKVTTEQLKPGMILSKHLTNSKGMVLLMEGHIINDNDISTLLDFEQLWNQKLMINIQS